MKAISLIITVVAALSLAGLSAAIAAGNSASRPATVSTARTGLGRIIVNGQGRTLYLFEKDRKGRSACSGTCATYWPPLLTHGKPIAANGARQALIGTTRRSDGTTQVTYAGHPVYRFMLDSKRGQTKGEGLNDFGGGWDALSPAGKKIEGD
jgi:predicted lipoprotein with Yx(FWY)xxD motif